MKKFITLMLALVAVVAVNAKQVTFDFTNPTALGVTPSAEKSKGVEIPAEGITVDGIVMTSATVQKNANVIFTKTDGATYELRTYNTNSITFTAEENITAVEFVGSDVKYSEVTGKSWVATSEVKTVTFTGTGTSKITSIVVTVGEAANIWSPDTVGVTQARALIDAKDAHDHFVTGVVAGAPFTTGNFEGKVCFWMTDVNNAKDSLEAFQVFDKNNAKWASLAAAKQELKKGDTVLVYASGLLYYEAKKYYEINGGHYVEKLGAAPEVEAETITIAEAITKATALADNATSDETYYVEGFAANVYAYSAKYGNQDFFLVEDAAKPDSVLKVYRATPVKEGKAYPVLAGDKLGITGNLQKYVKDGKTQLEIVNPVVKFLAEVEGDRTIEEEQPAKTDTITVAQALEIGKKLADKAVSPIEYVIKGYSCDITQAYDTAYKNETFWIADEKGTRTSDKAKAFYVYRGKPKTQAEIGLDALIQIKCKIKNYGGTIENDGMGVEFEVLEQGVIETIDTITVAEALKIGQGLTQSDKNNKYPSEKRYAIKGYVSEIVDYFDPTFKNETFWITDEKGARTSDKAVAFEVYRGKPNPAQEVGFDAYVQVVCKIVNFQGTIENYESNAPVQVLEPGLEVKVDTVSVAEALAIGDALQDNAYTENPYVVIGYVTKAYEPDSGYTNQNFYMADDPTERGNFYAFRTTCDEKVKDGDYVQLFGKIQKYIGKSGPSLQIGYGKATHLTAPKIDTLSIAEVLTLELEEGATTEDRVVVIGYVASIESPYEEDLQSFSLSDSEAATTGEFKAVDAEIAEPGAALHDRVAITGKIQKRDGVYRMVSGKAVVLGLQGIENVVLTEKAQKVLIDGVIYIIRDNKIYNLQGTQVR